MNTEDETNDDKPFFEDEKKLLEKYGFNLGEAVEEVKLDFQIGDVADKAKSSAKLLGKFAFNSGLIAGKYGLGAIKNLPQFLVTQAKLQAKNNSDLSDEQRNKLEEFAEKHDK